MEDAPGGRADVEKTYCVSVAATGRLRGPVQRWEDDPVRQCDMQWERSAREDRRLKLIYAPIDKTSNIVVSWQHISPSGQVVLHLELELKHLLTRPL